MTHNVIIGGGPVATNALETIREFDGGHTSLFYDDPQPWVDTVAPFVKRHA